MHDRNGESRFAAGHYRYATQQAALKPAGSTILADLDPRRLGRPAIPEPGAELGPICYQPDGAAG